MGGIARPVGSGTIADFAPLEVVLVPGSFDPFGVPRYRPIDRVLGNFVDDGDLRRPTEFPRLAERRAAAGEAVWMPPSRRKLFKGTAAAVNAKIVDLSVGGALITSQVNDNIKVGAKIRFQINGAEGIVEVRTVRRYNDRIAYYGISFFRISDALRHEVFDLLSAPR